MKEISVLCICSLVFFFFQNRFNWHTLFAKKFFSCTFISSTLHMYKLLKLKILIHHVFVIRMNHIRWLYIYLKELAGLRFFLSLKNYSTRVYHVHDVLGRSLFDVIQHLKEMLIIKKNSQISFWRQLVVYLSTCMGDHGK